MVACAHDLAYNLALMKHHKPVSANELKRARMNLKADRMYGEETVSGQARAIGHALTTPHKMAYDAVYEARVHASSSESIHNALNRWLTFDKAFIVALVPESFGVDEDELQKAYCKGIEKAEKEFPIDPFKTIAKSEELKAKAPIFTKEISSGIQFVYRENESSDFFNLIAVTQGGLRFEDKKTAGLHYCIAEMLATQTSKLSHEALTELIEGSGSVLNGFSGKDSLGLRLQCFTENINEMLPIWADCLLNPVFSDLHWKNLQHDVADEIRSEQDSPAAIAVRRFSELVYRDHPYRFPVYGLWDNIVALNPKRLTNLFQKQRDAGPWTISGVGSLPANDAFDMVAAAFNSWQPASSRKQPNSHIELRHKIPAQHVKIEKNREQTHMIVGTIGRRLDDPDRYAIDVLTTVFGGSGGRLFVNLRDQKSLAYTVTPIMSYGCENGLFGVYIACAPGKVEEAKSAIFDEFAQISQELVSSEELTRAKNYLIGGHEAGMERGESQAMSMGLMSAYGVGATDFLEYSQHIQNVTAADVQRVALALLDPSRMTIVEVGFGGS
jgi:zinc protease